MCLYQISMVCIYLVSAFAHVHSNMLQCTTVSIQWCYSIYILWLQYVKYSSTEEKVHYSSAALEQIPSALADCRDHHTIATHVKQWHERFGLAQMQ